MKIHILLSAALLALAAPSLVACDDGAEPETSQQATDPANGKTISELRMSGDDRTTLQEGSTTQLTATVLYADGTTRDVTREAQWNTSDATNATVSQTGLVTGIDEGSVEIRVTYNGITETDTIIITNR